MTGGPVGDPHRDGPTKRGREVFAQDGPVGAHRVGHKALTRGEGVRQTSIKMQESNGYSSFAQLGATCDSRRWTQTRRSRVPTISGHDVTDFTIAIAAEALEDMTQIVMLFPIFSNFFINFTCKFIENSFWISIFSLW